MSVFTENIGIAPLPKEGKWTTTKSFRFYIHELGTGPYVDVPSGFQFDGASIPRIFWVLFPPIEAKTINAAALHDRLFYKKIYDYTFTNFIFYKALRISGNGLFKSSIFFIGVMIGGRIPWYFGNK